jgi:Zn-dependent peptidase ImmA (M78 family)
MNLHDQHIEETAKRALGNIECKEPPVPVEEIAKKLGLEVVEFPFHEKISGLLKKEEGIIAVNKGQHPVRRRFTIAHELGHFLLGHDIEKGVDETIDDTFDKPYPQEREANLFASALLMPSEWVTKEFKAQGSDLSKVDLDKLASTFGVSKQAMTIRLLALKLI